MAPAANDWLRNACQRCDLAVAQAVADQALHVFVTTVSVGPTATA
jgi:hypothetical protein